MCVCVMVVNISNEAIRLICINTYAVLLVPNRPLSNNTFFSNLIAYYTKRIII